MKSNYVYPLLVLICACVSLFIPYWYFPFIVSLFLNIFIEQSLFKRIVFHGLMYFLACIIYCYMSYATGNQKLMLMLSEIFMNASVFILINKSSLIFALLAIFGAWCGNTIYEFRNPTAKDIRV